MAFNVVWMTKNMKSVHQDSFSGSCQLFVEFFHVFRGCAWSEGCWFLELSPHYNGEAAHKQRCRVWHTSLVKAIQLWVLQAGLGSISQESCTGSPCAFLQVNTFLFGSWPYAEEKKKSGETLLWKWLLGSPQITGWKHWEIPAASLVLSFLSCLE